MATLRKRGEYSWEAQIRKKGFPTQTKTFNYRKDAEDWARIVESEIARGLFIPRRDAETNTFDDVAKKFADEYAPHHYRVRDDKKEAWRFQLKHLRSSLGRYSIAALTPAVVTKYRDDRLQKVAGTTVRKEVNLLSKVLRVASQEFGITLPNGNPVANIRKPTESKARSRRLTGDEATRLLKECQESGNPWLLPAVTLAIETAMRQGELLALRWENVDLKRKLAFIEISKNGEARTVPLSPVALAVLKGLPRSISGFVLPVKRMALAGAYRAAVARAGISDITFHDLRHEALSRLAERGDFSVLELAAVSGHKTLQMLKRYTHLQAESLAKKLAKRK